MIYCIAMVFLGPVFLRSGALCNGVYHFKQVGKEPCMYH